ncbi:MAG: YlxR family protein [Clostridia bacterium]|nr:YlxR family protein [Clostridia bacterium]
MKSVHQPTRECISCGEKFPKAELLRIVKNDSGIFLDTTGKQNGRGAYICKNPECAEKLVKQKRLNRAFKTAIDESVYRELLEMLHDGRTE